MSQSNTIDSQTTTGGADLCSRSSSPPSSVPAAADKVLVSSFDLGKLEQDCLVEDPAPGTSSVPADPSLSLHDESNSAWTAFLRTIKELREAGIVITDQEQQTILRAIFPPLYIKLTNYSPPERDYYARILMNVETRYLTVREALKEEPRLLRAYQLGHDLATCFALREVLKPFLNNQDVDKNNKLLGQLVKHLEKAASDLMTDPTANPLFLLGADHVFCPSNLPIESYYGAISKLVQPYEAALQLNKEKSLNDKFDCPSAEESRGSVDERFDYSGVPLGSSSGFKSPSTTGIRARRRNVATR